MSVQLQLQYLSIYLEREIVRETAYSGMGAKAHERQEKVLGGDWQRQANAVRCARYPSVAVVCYTERGRAMVK